VALAKAPPLGRRRVCIAKDLLASILRCQRLSAGERIYSNLPEDARILSVYEHPDDVERGSVHFTAILESSEWPPGQPGDLIPELLVVFHREQAT